MDLLLRLKWFRYFIHFCHIQKRNKRRYYVLHHHSSEWKTRLDCFENLKKFKASEPPRSTIYLSDLFSVASSGWSDSSPISPKNNKLDSQTSSKIGKSDSPASPKIGKSDLTKNSKSSICTFTLFTNYEKITLVADTEKEKQMWVNVIQFNKDQEDNPSSSSTSTVNGSNNPLLTATTGDLLFHTYSTSKKPHTCTF